MEKKNISRRSFLKLFGAGSVATAEGTLEDGVGAVAEADFSGNLGGVDDVHRDVVSRGAS